ncbi:MAG: pyridoxamine 5'-phosphate oxidase family protein [Desulfobacterota bacterium]|nr:pyridoxamine 5'-phosphate oxidase family protein [Thermodesulfobacteriota bacterium]
MKKDDIREKVIALITRNRYAKLITNGPDGTPRARIMTNLPIGKDMIIWFATGLSTSKVQDIKNNPHVSVFVDDPDDHVHACISGTAEIITNDRLRRKYWREGFAFFFPGGPTDPDYCLLKITPRTVEYMDPGPMFLQKRRRDVVKL